MLYLKYHLGTGGNWTIQQVHQPRYSHKSHIAIFAEDSPEVDVSTEVGFHTQAVRDYIRDLVGYHNGFDLAVVTEKLGLTAWDDANSILEDAGENWNPHYTGIFWPVRMQGVDWHGRYDGILTNCPAYLLNKNGKTVETIRG